jgi:hypothetical protein
VTGASGSDGIGEIGSGSFEVANGSGRRYRWKLNARHFGGGGSANSLPFAGDVPWHAVATVVEAYMVIAQRRLLRWIWFPGQPALIAWELVSLGPAD